MQTAFGSRLNPQPGDDGTAHLLPVDIKPYLRVVNDFVLPHYIPYAGSLFAIDGAVMPRLDVDQPDICKEVGARKNITLAGLNLPVSHEMRFVYVIKVYIMHRKGQ